MRILVLGGLSKKGLKFIETVGMKDYLIVVDSLSDKEAGRRLMGLLIKRKLKFYEGGREALIKIVNFVGGVDLIRDFSKY